MNGTIVNFVGGRHTQVGNQMVVQVEGVSTKEKAEALVGKAVSWKSPANKELKGKVTRPHGNSGAVKVLFESGMPGQSVGQKVQLA